MLIVRNRKIFYTVSAVLVGVSLLSIAFFGLNLGIDFRGGAIFEVYYGENPPAMEMVRGIVAKQSLGESVRPTGERGFIIRLKDVSEEKRSKLVSALSGAGGKFEVKRFDSIGPILGKEAGRKALISIVLVIMAIVLFVTWAFRRVSEPVASWKYGIITIIALLHDVIIPTGLFAVLGRFGNAEIDTLFVTALLVILGFSVHDTIVVFDRVRENLKFRAAKSFEEIVGGSITQTLVRSINTSLTTLLAIAALYLLGPEATRMFSLALFVGIVAGTYSSIFLGSPLLVTAEMLRKRK